MERYSDISFADFRSEFLYLLGKHAPFKKRYIRANQKNVMARSNLRNKFLKLKTEENRVAYAKQRNYCCDNQSYHNKKSDNTLKTETLLV